MINKDDLFLIEYNDKSLEIDYIDIAEVHYHIGYILSQEVFDIMMKEWVSRFEKYKKAITDQTCDEPRFSQAALAIDFNHNGIKNALKNIYILRELKQYIGEHVRVEHMIDMVLFGFQKTLSVTLRTGEYLSITRNENRALVFEVFTQSKGKGMTLKVAYDDPERHDKYRETIQQLNSYRVEEIVVEGKDNSKVVHVFYKDNLGRYFSSIEDVDPSKRERYIKEGRYISVSISEELFEFMKKSETGEEKC